MNYKDRITLYYYSESRYNPETKRKEINKDNLGTFACNINSLTAENVRLEFGEITKDINVVRIPKVIGVNPTHALINSKQYKIVKVKHYQRTTSLFIKEVT
ncbi:hypothetical protein CD116_13520 [Staphylococcus schweitzeri]|uniref:Phage-like protein n=1 Tax=Staphylococcus schweitzeri TaxID=1654388 RepID=A0A2K4ADZ7_9STAP|nr:hypothetical protein [Staphylococcus schweitzeri]MBE2128548.1 hypothetical protein [Staphylococcus schweitzeri]PNZ48310.1 hypothetical protein CD116_13520 [Staphylococcus schweitzeri]CDR26525.1 phage-like protein [Staphylococcus schweitzeri]CDR53600.1 phage-like protein [Staphylococcus schweitzeri]CDR65339.1 phage-like protein [Staphylococcus schweitzeri]